MANFEFGDTPDYYDTAQLPRYWDLASSMEVAAGDGYGGGDAWEGGGADAYAVAFPASVHPTRWGMVVRVKIDALPAAANILLAVVDAGDPPEIHVSAVLNSSGTVSIIRGDTGGTILGTSSGVLPSDGSTFRLGFEGLISPVAGNATVWFAAGTDPLAELVQVGGVNTDGVGSGVRRGVYLGGVPDVFLSQLYCQGSGTLPEAPLCDVLMPLEDSELMQWDVEPSESPPNMSAVTDEVPANDDSDYGFSTELGQSYALHHETAPARTNYLGTRSVALVENAVLEAPAGSPPTPAPSYTFTPLVRNAGGSLDVGSAHSVSDAEWIAVDRVYPTNPFSGLPWTTAAIDAFAWGGRTTV